VVTQKKKPQVSALEEDLEKTNENIQRLEDQMKKLKENVASTSEASERASAAYHEAKVHFLIYGIS